MHKPLQKQGFTLVELIIVIAILAILAVVLVPLINNFIEKSRAARCINAVAAIESASTAFLSDNARLPDLQQATLLANSEMFNNISNLNSWQGPYLGRNISGMHPWGGSYVLGVFAIPTVGNAFLADWFLSLFSGDKAPPIPGIIKGIKIPSSIIEFLDIKTDGRVDLQAGKFQSSGDGFFVFVIEPDAVFPKEVAAF